MSDSAALRGDAGGCSSSRLACPKHVFSAGLLVATPIDAGLPGWPLAPWQPRLKRLYLYTMCKPSTNRLLERRGALIEPLGMVRSRWLALQPLLREAWSGKLFRRPSQLPPNRWCVLEEASERNRGKSAFCFSLGFGLDAGQSVSRMAMLTYPRNQRQDCCQSLERFTRLVPGWCLLAAPLGQWA